MNRNTNTRAKWQPALSRAAAAIVLWMAISGAGERARAQSPSVAQAGSPGASVPTTAPNGPQVTVAEPQPPLASSQLPISTGAATAVPSDTGSAPASDSMAPPPAPSTGQQSRPKDNAPAIVGYVGVTAAAVGAIVGIISGAMAWSRTSQLKSDCSGSVCPANRLDDVNSTKNLAGLSTISFSFALFGAAIGVTGFVLSNDARATDSPPTSSLNMRAVVGLGSAAVEGSF